MASTTIPLNSNWTFKQGGLESTSEYLEANDLPTEIHRDLLHNNKIADPFLDLNELSVRWVAEEAWTYRTAFPAPPSYQKDNVKTVLKFEGLDTFASVYLNGDLILESDNMFIEHKVDVSSRLKEDEANTLELVFESARKKGLELVQQHPEHRFIVHQTEVSRGPVRKAQYHWGWDWGPILLSSGPWKPISLETYTSRIEDVWVLYDLSDDLKKATGKVFCKVEGPTEKTTFLIERDDEKVLELDGQLVDGIFEAAFELEVELWWPRGYGSQTLYTITATTEAPEITLHRVSKNLGFRKVELVQENDSIGTSFYFRINNTDIFAGGSCWVPADSFLTSVTPETYQEWIRLAAEGNQTMIRVWGGGIYEADAFYEACDREGVIVWQDFMFACANYPAYPEYLESVETEARQAVQRIRNHPSVIIWAGNNEDYQIVERYNLEYRYEDKDPSSWLKTDFPARYIYEYLLPKIIKEEAKGVPYHPSSPFGNGTSTTLKVDPTVGDIHQWNLWHGDMHPYQNLPNMGGRFVSEFGMEAYSHLQTINKSITQEASRYPGSMAMDFRNKAVGHERRLVTYVAENFRLVQDLPGFTHLTQVMQADSMAWAYKSWRRQWGTEGKRQCGGVLVWQLNDCWPTMSWAVVDYYLVPKPAYYAIKREMDPITIGVTRKFHSWTMRPADDLWKRDTGHIDMRQIWEDVQFDVWVTSIRPKEINGKVTVKFISIRSGDEVQESIIRDVLISPNGTTEIISKQKVQLRTQQDENSPYDISKADPFVISTTLSIDGKDMTADISWPDPIKYLDFPERGVNVARSGLVVTVSAEKPVKGFVFSEKEGTRLSDNGFDILPGCPREIRISGRQTDVLEYRYIGM